jgi:hypothetical protein
VTDPIVLILDMGIVTILSVLALVAITISAIVQIKNELDKKKAIKKLEQEWDEFKEEYLKGGDK